MSSMPEVSERSAAAADLLRARSNASGSAKAHASGSARWTSDGAKLKNVASTTPGRTAPMGAARMAK